MLMQMIVASVCIEILNHMLSWNSQVNIFSTGMVSPKLLVEEHLYT